MITPALSRLAAELLFEGFPSIETRLRVAEARTDDELLDALEVGGVEGLTAGVLDDAAAELNPSRVIFEFDRPTEFDQREDLDRETAYQIKFFYGHGFWASERLSGDKNVDWKAATRIAVGVVTDPLNPSSETTRDRLILEGLLF